MKLVEILVREWSEWPQALVSAFQEKNGAIWGNMWFDYKDALGIVNIADDWETALITRGQWQAERDRMKAMETQQATASTEPTYEQQLWDRAYADAWRNGFSVLGSDCPTEYFQSMTQASARMADAFMVERAKRVGK